MVMTLSIIARKIFNLENLITVNHLEKMNKIMLLTGMMVGYAYMTEFFIAWYSGNIYEQFAFLNRAFGNYAWAYWIMISCNVLIPQLFWFKKLRRSIAVMFIASIFINIGMWFERFVIVVTSLSRDFLPANWDYYSPSIWDILTFVGSFGLFFTLFLLFIRVLPMISMSEVKGVLPEAEITPPEAGLSQDEIKELFNIIKQTDLRYFTKLNTYTALNKLLSGKIPTDSELELLERMYGSELGEALAAKRTKGQKIWDATLSVLNLPRAVLASFDLSAPLRQVS